MNEVNRTIIRLKSWNRLASLPIATGSAASAADLAGFAVAMAAFGAAMVATVSVVVTAATVGLVTAAMDTAASVTVA